MGILVSIVVTFSVANYERGQVEITGAMSLFSMPAIIHTYPVYRQTWMPLVAERYNIARELSNEHEPCAVAVVENAGGGAVGGSGCTTCLCTVKPKASICSGCQFASEGEIMEAIPVLGQARKQGHNEMYASTQQGRNELHAGMQQ